MIPVSLNGHVSFTDVDGAHLQAKMAIEATDELILLTVAPVTPSILLPLLRSTDPSVARFVGEWIALISQASRL